MSRGIHKPIRNRERGGNRGSAPAQHRLPYPENEFGRPDIPSDALTIDLIPDLKSDFGQIEEFALTYDAYTRRESADDARELASRASEAFGESGVLPRTIEDLRTCLFFEQRRWHWDGESCTRASVRYARALVAAIRASVLDRGGSTSTS